MGPAHPRVVSSADGFAAFGRLRSAVKADLRGLDPGPDALVLVGCSGGVDSLALAAALVAEAREVARSTRQRGYEIRVGAVIVDHGLQDDSAEVAERAAQQCRELGLSPVSVRRVEVDSLSDGVEAAARAARFRAFDAAIAETGAVALYLGHTLDDQAESVLLGLARGSGARSLAGMRHVRGPYRRPLIGLRRADTAATCAFLGLAPWLDPSNSAVGADAPLRSRVRAEVLPLLEGTLGPGVAEALARSAELLRQDADALDAQAEELFTDALPWSVEQRPQSGRVRRNHQVSGANELTLEIGPLQAASAAIRRRALRLAALASGAPAGSLSAAHIAALDTLVANWRGQGPVSLPTGITVSRRCGRLVFLPAKSTGIATRKP